MGSYLQNVQNKIDYENALRTEETSSKTFFKKFDSDFIELLLIGDEHIGAKNYHSDLHKKVLESSYNDKRYIIHMGDGLETATRNSIGAGIYEQAEIIDKQVNTFQALYQPFVDEKLFLGGHPGNHEMRVFKDEGLNLTRHMYREMKARYFGIAKVSILRVGNQTYTLYTTHGSSGAQLPYTKIKGALDMEKIIDVELYAMGHVHQLSHHVRNYNKPNLRNKTLETKQKHFVLTGSYLDYWDSYAQIKNLEPARMGSPIIKLYGDEHRIKASLQ